MNDKAFLHAQVIDPCGTFVVRVATPGLQEHKCCSCNAVWIPYSSDCLKGYLSSWYKSFIRVFHCFCLSEIYTGIIKLTKRSKSYILVPQHL